MTAEHNRALVEREIDPVNLNVMDMLYSWKLIYQLMDAARAEGPQPIRIEGEDLEWARTLLAGVKFRHPEHAHPASVEGALRYNARIDRILAALSSPPPPSGGELARADLDRIHHALHRELDRLGAPRFADAFNPDCPAPMDVLSRLSALPQTRTGEGE